MTRSIAIYTIISSMDTNVVIPLSLKKFWLQGLLDPLYLVPIAFPFSTTAVYIQSLRRQRPGLTLVIFATTSSGRPLHQFLSPIRVVNITPFQASGFFRVLQGRSRGTHVVLISAIWISLC